MSQRQSCMRKAPAEGLGGVHSSQHTCFTLSGFITFVQRACRTAQKEAMRWVLFHLRGWVLWGPLIYVPTCWAALCAETAVPAKHEPLSHGGPKASLLPGLVGSHGSPGGPKTFFPTLFISLSNRRVLLDLAEAMQYFWSSCVPMYLSISSISIFLDMGRSVQYSSSQIYSPFKISVAVHHNI